MNKKGELSSSQLVTIIILIASFAVILIFFFMFNLKGEITKESCKNSVVMRGTALSKSVVQLQCETNDVCFSKSGNCDLAKKGTEIIRVVDKPALINELGNLMYGCWWQFGEGKIDYRASGIGDSESYCAVCNIIKFDSSIRNSAMNSISLKELYESLQNRKVPNKDINYLQYLYGLNNFDAVRDNVIAVTDSKVNIESQSLDFSQESVALITSLTKSGWALPAVGGTGGAVATGVVAYALGFSNPIGWAIGGGIIVGTIVYKSTDNGLQYMPPTFYKYNSEDFKALNCKEFTTLA